MTGIYGHKWVTSYGDEVSETWVRGCADLTGTELGEGLRSCLKRSEVNKRAGDEDWPPTLGEFRMLCRPNRAAYHQAAVRLPAPQLTPEQIAVIDADILALRQKIKDDRAKQEAEMLASREERFQRLRQREPGDDDEVKS